MPAINDVKILIMATHGFEQSELEAPRDKLKSTGATVHIATPDGADVRGWKVDQWGDMAFADLRIDQVKVEDYDALVLPGGQINPDLLRVNETAVALVREFAAKGRTVAAICHAPWLLIEAGVVEGREMTGYPSIRTDLRNAGARVIDAEVACEKGIVTSRDPSDLDAFVNKIIEEVQEGRHERQPA